MRPSAVPQVGARPEEAAVVGFEPTLCLASLCTGLRASEPCCSLHGHLQRRCESPSPHRAQGAPAQPECPLHACGGTSAGWSCVAPASVTHTPDVMFTANVLSSGRPR